MTSLFAIVFNDRQTADRALAQLRELQKGAVLALHDAVFVTRTGEGAVKLDQSVNVAAVGALTGAFWGSLIGLIFLSPLLGAAVGAAAGGLGGYLSDYGINDEFIQSMGNRLAPGRTALFVLASNVTPDRVAAALEPHGGELFYSSFAPEVEQRFCQTVAGQPMAAEQAANATSTSTAAPASVGSDAASGQPHDAPDAPNPQR
jgi:uncharacterized membrane protein